MSTMQNIEWFSVEEKEPPKFESLLLVTPEKIVLGFASVFSDDKYPEAKGKTSYSSYNGLLLRTVRYWAAMPSYPGNIEETEWDSQWRLNFRHNHDNFKMFTDGQLVGVRFI